MSWLRRLSNTLRRGRLQREIDRELSFHLAERTDDLCERGLHVDEATRAARRRFGNVTAHSERTQDVDISLWLDASVRNVRYALRTLRRTPAFSATVILTLALGIGANAAVFSAIDAVLLQPLPFPDGDRLVRLRQTHRRTGETNIAPVRLEEWNRLNSTFDGITGYFTEDVSEISGELPERIRRAWVAPRFLEVFGVAPARGRGFTDSEHKAGGPLAVLISDRYWRRRFAADEHVIGRTLRIGTASLPIVGVMPASFFFPDRDVDLWCPVSMSARLMEFRNATWYRGLGRHKRDVTTEQARAQLGRVQGQLADRYPDTDRELGVTLERLKETVIGNVRGSLWLLFGAVSVLLLITCTNIAALLLSRATHRRDEIWVRLSLGASRRAVAAQLLTESAVLAFMGGVLGLAAAAGASAAFQSVAADLPRVNEIVLDARILGYTTAITIGVAFLCGLLPAMRTARGDITGMSGEAGRAQVSRRSVIQWLLVGVQVALSVTLLAAAGLLVRSFQELSRVNPGFEPSRVLTFRVSGNWNETADYGRLIHRIDGTLEALQSLPGVERAATAIFLPGMPAQYESTFALVEARGDTDSRLVAESRIVSPEYFATLRIPLIAGQPCVRQPVVGPMQLVVNRAFVLRYLSTRTSPVGLHLKSGSAPASHPIVGVVGDARERGLDREPGPVVYSCMSAPNPMPYFLVQTRDEPMALAQTVRLKLKELDPLRAVYDIAPLEARIGGAFAQHRLRTTLLVFFALTALSLACVGLYGTLSYVITLRRREIGLRLALGAQRSVIVRHFLVQGLRVAALACLCGVALSIGFGRLLSGMLFGVSPSDAVTMSGVIAIVLVVTGLAALVPAARAARVDPRDTLQET